MRDFALIQISPDRFLVGWGPFRSASAPAADHPAFYINRYFLDSETPWKIPEAWEVVEAGDLSAMAGQNPRLAVVWEAPDDRLFQALFHSAHSALADSSIRKVVPVLFEEGSLDPGSNPAPWLVSRLPAIPPPLLGYGYSIRGEGMIGASPEILFRLEGSRLETMAVAGTRATDHADELLSDQKEREEHNFVIRDIANQLEHLGAVVVGETEILRLPGLAHLMTRVSVQLQRTRSFDEIVTLLHPTAALGSWPRSKAASDWLKTADRGIDRHTFGAPFGVRFEDGSSLCLVAIRNVAWNGGKIRIGSGAGILRESQLDRERKELSRKREQVKQLFEVHGDQPR